MARWGYSVNRWNATTEEKNSAATMRNNIIAAIECSESMYEDAKEWAKWCVLRVSEEAIIRKLRRGSAEEWYERAISSLKRGDTFTQAGLLETFNAPDEVRNYATFILSEWAHEGHLIRVNMTAGDSLMRGSLNCNIYEVL